MNAGLKENLFDILGMIDHEYIHYKGMVEIRSLLNKGEEVKKILKDRTPTKEERRTIDIQSKSKYYAKTSDNFKKAMDDYYANPDKNYNP